MCDPLGTIRNHGYDANGYERRERLDAIVECPTCGKEVACWSDTEEWVQTKDGRWKHRWYAACAMGECCGKVLIADGLSGECFSIGE
jgi:hypothetical protein